MTLFDVTHYRPLPTVPMPAVDEFASRYIATRTPVILDNVAEELHFVKDWSLEYFCKRMKTVRVHRPSNDGAYHFLKYDRVPVADFLKSLDTEKSMYTLEPLIGLGAPQGSEADRNLGFDESAVPKFIPDGRLKVSNLLAGPGSNKTLLHYDEVHSLLIMVEGEKRFMLYEHDQTKNLYPYNVLDIRSMIQQRVVDSRINPLAPDVERFPRLKNAVGWEGKMVAGQALFLPAGTWHYIESDQRNVAVNYFWHHGSTKFWLSRPLLDFWIKRHQLTVLDALRTVKSRAKLLFAGH